MNRANIIRTAAEIGVAAILSAIIANKDRQLKKEIANSDKAIAIIDDNFELIKKLSDQLEDARSRILAMMLEEELDDDED